MKKVLFLFSILLSIAGITHAQTIYVGNDGASDYGLPLYVFWNYGFSQQLYTPDEIGNDGEIQSISFKYTTGREMNRVIDVYMKHTGKQAFENHSDWEPVESSDLVYSGDFNIVNDSWITIELDHHFIYNGHDNLLLVVYDHTLNSASSQGGEFLCFEGAEGSSLRMFNDYNEYDPMNPSGTALQEGLKNLKNFLMVEFVPGTSIVENVDNFIAYPSPAHDILHVDGVGLQRIEIYNMMGQSVGDYHCSGNSLSIDVAKFTSGVYFIQVYSQGGTSVKKVTICH